MNLGRLGVSCQISRVSKVDPFAVIFRFSLRFSDVQYNMQCYRYLHYLLVVGRDVFSVKVIDKVSYFPI